MPERTVQYLTECHADTALLHYFIPDRTLTIHCTGCPEVGNTMLSSKADEYKLIGMVDNDGDLELRCKGYFKTFKVVGQEHKVVLRENPIRQQYLIIIDKAVESFLIWNAGQVGIDMNAYGFSSDKNC